MASSPQKLANAAKALLILDELVRAGLITIEAEFYPEKAAQSLAELARSGVFPDEERSIALATGMAIELGFVIATEFRA